MIIGGASKTKSEPKSAGSKPGTSSEPKPEPKDEAKAIEWRDPRLTDRAIQQINYASDVATKELTELKLIQDEVGKMGFMQLFWDAKAPKKSSRLFNLSSSDPAIIKQELEIYQGFYGQLTRVMHLLRTGDGEGIDRVDVFVDELCQELKDLSEKAKTKAESSDSKTLVKAHSHFVEKHDKLECTIRRVESEVSRIRQKELVQKLQDSLTKIDTLLGQVQRVSGNMEVVAAHFEEMETKLAKSEEEKDDLKTIVQNVKTETDRLTEQIQANAQEKKEFEFLIEDMKDESAKLSEQLEDSRRQKLEMDTVIERMKNESETLSKLVQKMLTENSEAKKTQDEILERLKQMTPEPGPSSDTTLDKP